MMMFPDPRCARIDAARATFSHKFEPLAVYAVKWPGVVMTPYACSSITSRTASRRIASMTAAHAGSSASACTDAFSWTANVKTGFVAGALSIPMDGFCSPSGTSAAPLPDEPSGLRRLYITDADDVGTVGKYDTSLLNV